MGTRAGFSSSSHPGQARPDSTPCALRGPRSPPFFCPKSGRLARLQGLRLVFPGTGCHRASGPQRSRCQWPRCAVPSHRRCPALGIAGKAGPASLPAAASSGLQRWG